MQEITNIPVNEIMAGTNDRKVFCPVKLKELAASIEDNGLAQPITVRRISTDLYQIVAGERRFRAIAEVLKLDTVPAIIRELTDQQASDIMLAENTGREDLNPIEEANAYQTRIQAFEQSPEQIAKIAGVSTQLVKSRVKLLQLNPEIQHLVAHGNFPLGHAEIVAELDNNRQNIAARIYSESNGLPLTTFKGIVSQLLEEQSQDSLFDLGDFWVKQVQETTALPKSGKKAITGAPTRKDLPAVPITHKASDRTGALIDRYITELLNSGFEGEAAAVGNLYNALVHGNFTSVPAGATLLQ